MASCYWRTCYFVKLELLSLKLSRFFWKESFSFLEIIQIMNCKMLNALIAGISVIYFKIVIHIQVCLWRLILQVFISRWEYTVTPLCVCLSVTFCHICSQQLETFIHSLFRLAIWWERCQLPVDSAYFVYSHQSGGIASEILAHIYLVSSIWLSC